MTLRWRLVISLVWVVAAIVTVGAVALEISGRLQTKVGHLSRRSGVTLPSNPERQTLEIEGVWSDGSFVASEIDRLPGARRPKLRGAIDMVDSASGRFGMFGLVISTDSSTEFFGPPGEVLVVGQRVEVSCKVDSDDRWTARRIRAGGIKASDKIKGMITRYRADGEWPDTLAIHGLVILVGHDKSASGERTQLHRIGAAAHMGVSLRQILNGSNQLASTGATPATINDLQVFAGDFQRTVNELSTSAPDGSDEKVSWLNELAANAVALRGSIDSLITLTDLGGDFTLDYHQTIIAPLIRDRLLPLVDAYRLDAEEALADQVTDLMSDAEIMKRVILITTVVAVVIASFLGIGLWRAVSGPLLALSAAAQSIGSGNLDTRVEEPSTGELGEVARSFNTMAQELAASTVSIEKLNIVRDELRQSLAERDLLLKEIHHRVKNNLQIVSSLLDLQSSHVTDSDSLELFKESRNRIRSMALIHEQLYRSTDFGQIEFRTYVELLVDGLARSLGCDGRIEFRLDLEPVHLDADRAVACGLIINELVTNSIKHAFSRTEHGEVTISFRCDGGSYELSIRDNGCGLPEDSTTETGSLGFEIVTSLSTQLRGTLSRESNSGTHVSLLFPSTIPVQEETR